MRERLDRPRRIGGWLADDIADLLMRARAMLGLLPWLACWPCVTPSRAVETCRFAGTTDHAGRAAIVAIAGGADGTARIDVVLRFEATTMLLPMRYLVEEISQWRDGVLQRLDTNTRYVFAGSVVRQQWDRFERVGRALQAYRIQGKRPAQFRAQYPRFASHWDLDSFGQDWLADYAASAPVRRPDLDLDASQSPDLQAPFALAFYRVRFLHPGAQHAQVFLPGFKADKLADIAIMPGQPSNGRVWQAVLHHAYLRAPPQSTATALLSPDGHLQRLSFQLHGTAGSAGGSLNQTGCTGAVPR